jgi:hypothetical protein
METNLGFYNVLTLMGPTANWQMNHIIDYALHLYWFGKCMAEQLMVCQPFIYKYLFPGISCQCFVRASRKLSPDHI